MALFHNSLATEISPTQVPHFKIPRFPTSLVQSILNIIFKKNRFGPLRFCLGGILKLGSQCRASCVQEIENHSSILISNV